MLGKMQFRLNTFNIFFVMKTFLKILGGLVGLVVVLLLVGFLLPAQVHVERSQVIKAPAGLLYEQVNQLKAWNAWSPWHGIDPKTQYTFSEPASGVGSWYTWTSKNPNVGNGKLSIDSVVPAQFIRTRLEFEGMEPAFADYIFQSEGEGTKVTWTMDADMGGNPLSRWFGLFFDGMIGPDYEKGLSGLARVADSLQKIAPAMPIFDVKVEQTQAFVGLGVAKTAKISELSELMGPMYGQVAEAATAQKLTIDKAFNITTMYDEAGGNIAFIAGMITNQAGKAQGSVTPISIPAQTCAVVDYFGPYEGLEAAYRAIMAWGEKNGKKLGEQPREIYMNNPEEVKDPAKFHTRIYWPIEG